DLIHGFESLGADDRVTDIPRDDLLGGSREAALAQWGDADAVEQILRKPCQLGAGIHQRVDCGADAVLILRVPHGHADLKDAHALKIKWIRRAGKRTMRCVKPPGRAALPWASVCLCPWLPVAGIPSRSCLWGRA